MSHIENESRYEAAKRRNIQINARKGNTKRFLAEAEDHAELRDWLLGNGEYSEYIWVEADGVHDEGHAPRNNPMRQGIFAGDFGSMLLKLADQLEEWGKLTPKQVEVVRNAFARKKEWVANAAAQRAEEDANAKPIPATDGRTEITGEILSIKWKESQYGGALKMVLKSDDGWKVYGTCPAGIDTAAAGDRVTFTAKIEIADDDPKFGFFKRPTKPAFVEKV